MDNYEYANSSFNASLNNDDGLFYDSEWVKVVRILRSVCVPVITGVGLVGNILTLLVFSTKKMKTSSCSVFLASLAFVDIVFLLSLLVTWIDGEVKVILSSSLTCQLVIFTTYVTSFLSAWFIVGFTCERFIAICFPFKGSYLCSVFREKIVVGILCIVAFALYNFSFWTAGMQEMGPFIRCSHNIKYFQFLHIATWVDTFLTMIVPFLLILSMNCLVVRCVLKGPKKKPGGTVTKSACATELIKSESSKNNSRTGSKQHNRSQRQTPQLRVTRTLLLVSSTYLFLNLPSHVIRLYNLIRSVTTGVIEVNPQFYFLQELTLMLYYTTFSCNFFLYALFGRNFKKSLSWIIRCKSTTKKHKETMMRKLNSTQGSCMTSL